MFTVYGAADSGSVVVEAALTWMGLPYAVVEAAPWGPPEQRAILETVSPLGQVPVLELPDGQRLTESVAILLWLADAKEGRPFAPGPGHPDRAAFLRWLIFIPANIYAMYTIKDNVAEWVTDGAAQTELTTKTIDRVAAMWRVMEGEVDPAPFIFGEDPTFLDLFVAVASRWTPRRNAFYAACPKLGSMVRRLDADPRLTTLWTERVTQPA